MNWNDIALLAVLIAVVFLPLASERTERNFELFLFAAGAIALSISHSWDSDFIFWIIKAPLGIAATVLVFGLAFYYGRKQLDAAMDKLADRLPQQVIVFLAVVALGFLASVITGVIASLLLVEIVKMLKLPREKGVKLTVLSCFSIGLGAALTPVGEPLSTVVIAQLNADFFYLFRLLGIYIVPSILLLGLYAALTNGARNGCALDDWEPETTAWTAFIRAAKVYIFVCALLMLGTALEPLAVRWIVPLPGHVLFWVNMISAAVDNATLAAAEINHSLHAHQITAALLGLLTSGGMLIPGNIPNIVAAGHLRISSREWARIGVPVGLVLMALIFLASLAGTA